VVDRWSAAGAFERLLACLVVGRVSSVRLGPAHICDLMQAFGAIVQRTAMSRYGSAWQVLSHHAQGAAFYRARQEN